MSNERETDKDVLATKKHLLASQNDKRHSPVDDELGLNWLGHSDSAKILDLLLLTGSSMPILMQKSGKTNAAIWNHIKHLSKEHGLTVVMNNGKYQIQI
jgi:biotin operon repressor